MTEDLFVTVLQLVRECKEVLKGGLLMKQYYQFMLRGIISDSQGLQTKANIDEFEEDLHEMLEASLCYIYITQNIDSSYARTSSWDCIWI